MPSDALTDWQGKRSAALDSLDTVHGKVTGRRVGRQYATKHYNLTMYVALAAEFQGFCRDLHDEVSTAIVLGVPPVAGRLVPVLLGALLRARQLDRGNAQPNSLGSDFQVLGMDLWPSLGRKKPRQSPKWNSTLARLNEIRNAVAHSDEAKLTEIRRQEPLDVANWRRKRSALNQLARCMDELAFDHVVALTGAAPW